MPSTARRSQPILYNKIINRLRNLVELVAARGERTEGSSDSR
jgi:hypothetical protein